MFKEEIINLLKIYVTTDIELATPPNQEFGDYAFPCFALAKEKKKSPLEIAKELANHISNDLKKNNNISKVESNGSYVNFFVKSSKVAEQILKEIYEKKKRYGHSEEHKGKTIVSDFSSPNVAKPFGMGHLRSTVIGNSVNKILRAQGYNVIGVNHIGDWGTPYGAYIVAFNKWGDSNKLEKEPIKHLYELYVRFNKEKETNDSLQEEAREQFKKLEEGDKESTKLWKKFRDLSLKEFGRIYGLLGVSFDSYNGEAFYSDKIESVFEEIKKKNICEESDGAIIVKIKGEEVPCILKKSDGASTYALRDLAAIKYRIETYNPEKILYFTDSGQSLHFKQIFTVANMITEDLGKTEFVHVPFGMLLSMEGKKMSTRQGTLILLDEVITTTINKVEKIISNKNPNLKNKKEVAKQVAVGAIIFGDLSNDRIKDIKFDWDKILDFEGDTGPYIQYTHARACSILRKAEEEIKLSSDIDYDSLGSDVEKELITQLAKMKEILFESAKNFKPHTLANYLIELTRLFNEFYHKNQVLKEEDEKKRNARLLLVFCSKVVISNSLDLLGVSSPDEM